MSYNSDQIKEYKSEMSRPAMNAIDIVNKALENELKEDGPKKSIFNLKSDTDYALSVMSKSELKDFVNDSLNNANVSSLVDKKEVENYFMFSRQHPTTGANAITDNQVIAAVLSTQTVAVVALANADKSFFEGSVASTIEGIGSGIINAIGSTPDAVAISLLALGVALLTAVGTTVVINKNKQDAEDLRNEGSFTMSKNQIVSDIIMSINPKEDEVEGLRSELKKLHNERLCLIYEDHYASETSYDPFKGDFRIKESLDLDHADRGFETKFSH